MKPILRNLTDAELEARLNADPDTPGALLNRIRDLGEYFL